MIGLISVSTEANAKKTKEDFYIKETIMVYTELNRQAQKKYKAKHRLRILVRKSKTRKSWENDIDEAHVKFLYYKQSGLCALTKLPLNNDSSIDRIDSTIGYIKGNIQLLLTIINRMKRDLPQQEFIELCKAVARNN